MWCVRVGAASFFHAVSKIDENIYVFPCRVFADPIPSSFGWVLVVKKTKSSFEC